MSRINTNVASLNAQHTLIGNNMDLQTRLQRLSTGLRINSGKDDPAGLIASESLRSEIRGIEKGISNSARASSVIATAEGALNEISSLLIDIKGLLVESANKGALSDEEIDANQLQVDSAINSIERIVNSAQFNGEKLLNGNLGYVTSGVVATRVSEATINSAKLIDGAAMTVDIETTTLAETGRVQLSLDGNLATAYSLEIGSGRGTTEITFAALATSGTMVSGINAIKEITGISAFASGGSLFLDSVDYGVDAFVSVTELTTGNGQAGISGSSKDFGVDVAGIINGAAATGTGKVLNVRTAMIDATFDLAVSQAALELTSTSFTITGGGSDFAIGPQVDAIGLQPIGISSLAPSQLGNATDGFINTLKSGGAQAMKGSNLVTAQRIVDSATKDISTLRGRLGAFQKNTLETNINSLQITLENVTAAESAIRDADFASETAALTRSQILVQANTSILSLANSSPQSVLALLG